MRGGGGAATVGLGGSCSGILAPHLYLVIWRWFRVMSLIGPTETPVLRFWPVFSPVSFMIQGACWEFSSHGMTNL